MTTTLQQPRRQPHLLPPAEMTITVEEIDAFAEAMAGCFDEMSPESKACAVDLGHALAKIRFKLTQ